MCVRRPDSGRLMEARTMADSGGKKDSPGLLEDLFQTRYREVTVSAIVFAIVVGVVMNAAITYAGLKIGFTIGGSAIAAVLGFGVLRGLLRRGTILETNLGQTAASAINTSNSGVIFTVPVLLLIGIPLSWNHADFWLITLACVAGAMLGTAFIIPLRKQMIEIDRLRFPTGTGVAVILKSPGAGTKKAIVLLVGILIGAVIYSPIAIPMLGETFSNAAMSNFSYTTIGDLIFGSDQKIVLGEKVNVGRWLGVPLQLELIFAIAPFALGAGYITGKAGLLVLAGGVLAYYILTPLAFSLGWMPEAILAVPEAAPGYGFQAFNRPLGIGLLLGGAMTGVAMSLPAIGAALKSMASAGKLKGGSDELGLKPLVVAAVAAFFLLFVAANIVGNKPMNSTDPVTGASFVAHGETAGVEVLATRPHEGYTIAFASDENAAAWDGWDGAQMASFMQANNAKRGWLAGFPPVVRAGLIALIGALWIWFAGIIIAQCTGMTDWSPISGMALITVVLVMMLAGTGAIIGAVLIGAALCVAITLAADMMQDLRTGHLVGAKPRRQQIIELCVVWMGPAITMATILIISQSNLKLYDAPMGPGTPTAAPQAQALQAVITGVQGGELPYALYGFGALIGALLGLGAFSGLGVLIGLSMYLPFYYIATYGIGCIFQMVLSKIKGRAWAEDWGVPAAAGLIVGESIFALVVNLIVVLAG